MKIAVLALFMPLALPQSSGLLTRVEETVYVPKRPASRTYIPSLWSGRALLMTEIADSRELILHAVTPDGLDEEIRYSMPGWGLLIMSSIWGGNDGRIVLAGNGQEDGGERGGFIGWIGQDRAEKRIVKVSGYSLHVMTVGPGGTVWAVGSNREAENILLRFSPDGKLLTSKYLAVRGGGKLQADGPPLGGFDVAAASKMRGNADRVAWLTRTNEYLEFDSSGSEILRLDVPGRDTWDHTMAISAANTVLIGMRDYTAKQPQQNLWSLDRIKKRWLRSAAAETSFPPNTEVYGFDGADLMTSGYKPQTGTLLVRYRLSGEF